MLRTMLTLDGFDVAESESGEDAVSTATKLRPDVILLDSTMRTAEGLTAAKRLRQADVAPGARIVFVSGHAGSALERTAYAAGCDSFLLKPMDFEQLLRVVRRLATPSAHEAR
jgi:CheY-like chemotaxis protein